MSATTGIGVDRFVFGTMRLHQLGEREAQELIRYLLANGVRRFHSSDEYDSFDFFCNVLSVACSDAGVDQGSLKHSVKLASPHFDEVEVSRARISRLLDGYRSSLSVETIHQVQWMARIDLKREDLRLNLMADSAGLISEIATQLKSDGHVHEFGCFPYTLGFAEAAIESGVFDNLVDYLNPLETVPLDYVESLGRAGMSLVALRPFAAGAGFETNQSVADLLRYVAGYSHLDGVVAGTGSLEHLDEILASL